jgi:hypothetical protein
MESLPKFKSSPNSSSIENQEEKIPLYSRQDKKCQKNTLLTKSMKKGSPN